MQYACLENSMDREIWWAMVWRVAKSQTRLKQLSTIHAFTLLEENRNSLQNTLALSDQIVLALPLEQRELVTGHLLSIYTCASWAPEQGSVRSPGPDALTPTAFAAPPTDDSAFRTSSGLLGDGLVATSCLTFATPWALSARLLCPWDSPSKNTGVDCHFPLQGIFPTQGSNPRLLLCRWVLYHWATREPLVFNPDVCPQQRQSRHTKEGLSGDLDPQRCLNATIPGLAEEKWQKMCLNKCPLQAVLSPH